MVRVDYFLKLCVDAENRRRDGRRRALKFIVCACALRCTPLFEKIKRRRHWVFFLCVLNTASLEL